MVKTISGYHLLTTKTGTSNSKSMIEILLASVMIVGKVDIAPDTVRYDILTESGELIVILDENSEVQ